VHGAMWPHPARIKGYMLPPFNVYVTSDLTVEPNPEAPFKNPLHKSRAISNSGHIY